MSRITALRTIRISERPNLIWVELEPKPKLVRRSCRSAMGLSKPSWPMRLRAGMSGEAPAFCKVGFCITLARSRAAQEATEEYRRRIRS
jgi:hypothetical protein